MIKLKGAFSSLGFNDQARSRQDKKESTSRIPRNHYSISLPNLNKHVINPASYSACVCDDETSEQPVDFSARFPDSRSKTNTCNCTYTNKVDNKIFNSNFSMYAETDLDQPTDYSLRYAEKGSESSKAETVVFVQDTIKTYCTEDTPYETPFNFSTSTSMSDLRIEDKPPKSREANTAPLKANIPRQVVKSEFSSGLMSPEKPVRYCAEGTPRSISRVASCGSLHSIPVIDPPKPTVKQEPIPVKKPDKEQRRTETKAVKFEDVVNYAEETPLMFSRSSSLSSLGSLDQHSIHDDRSSVVSDFSRLTSGLISPSELPDSPTQTVPPSPKARKAPKKTVNNEPTTTVDKKPGIFEDSVKNFDMEYTPIGFSSATSLSSLVINDNDDAKECPQVENNPKHNNEAYDLSESSEDEDILAACINIGIQKNKYSQVKPITPPPSNYNVAPINNTPSKIVANPMQKSFMINDSVRTYCTEGTPAILSHAGSNSDLSILSMPPNETVIDQRDLNTATQVEVPIIEAGFTYEDSSPSDEESEQALLQECILAGMPKNPPKEEVPVKVEESVELTPAEKVLLEQCILEGMKKNRIVNQDVENNLNDSHKSEYVEKNIDDGPTFRNSMELTEAEQALLKQCILSGIYNKSVVVNNLKEDLVEESSSEDEEDQATLADCINVGIHAHRYKQWEMGGASSCSKPANQNRPNNAVKNRPVLKNETVINDSVRNYYTEDTPACLSYAGSNSDLSVLSLQGNDYSSDVNSNMSEDDRLLSDCVKFGIAKTVQQPQPVVNKRAITTNNFQDKGATCPPKPPKVDLNISLESNISASSSASISSLSDDSYESEQALLHECILSGMSKQQHQANKLTEEDEALLQQCIIEGMQKCRISPRKTSSDLTEAEQALLKQCILSGMPQKSRNEERQLSDADRVLLQQCILAGMAKNRTNSAVKVKRPKEMERSNQGCCVHCPRSYQNRLMARRSGRLKRKTRPLVREGRDVNSFLYITSQLLAVKKELVDRSREEWV